MFDADVILYNTIGPAFTTASARTEAGSLGGSETELTQIAVVLANKGHKVIIANTVTERQECDNVLHIPFHEVDGMHVKALYIERYSDLGSMHVNAQTCLIRATDGCIEPYDRHRDILANDAILAGVSNWQMNSFRHAKNKIVITPMLGTTPSVDKIKGRFIFASAPCKGLDVTLDLWRQMKRRFAEEMKTVSLLIITPGAFDFYKDTDMMPELTEEDIELGISYEGSPSSEAYRAKIASSEGLFYVNKSPETFGVVSAFAERSATRTHILCTRGLGGTPEAIIDHTYLTESREKFQTDFIAALGSLPKQIHVIDRSPEIVVCEWEKVLRLDD